MNKPSRFIIVLLYLFVTGTMGGVAGEYFHKGDWLWAYIALGGAIINAYCLYRQIYFGIKQGDWFY
jgi:hypothetical protein